MAERYLHFEVAIEQRPKQGRLACGDVASVMRTESETTVIVADGIGSGTSAHVAATLCKSRFEQLLDGGFSLRQAFVRIAASMEHYKQPGMPYAAFTVAQIRSDGHAHILGYEAPGPIWAAADHAEPLPRRSFVMDGVTGFESTCYLRIGEGLLLISDGIAQAGLDKVPGGWQSKGPAEYVSGLINKGLWEDMPARIQRKACQLNNGIDYDDATVAWIRCRPARPLNILTGPPADRAKDKAVVERFMTMPGPKVICGATTAAIAARVLNRPIEIEKEPTSLIAPPRYFLEGIDLVSEGAVTLNQLNNVLELDAEAFYEISAVTELYDRIAAADRITIVMGIGQNPANNDPCFVQRGVLSREKIIPLIADKLRRQGKCVIIEKV
jgi:hypothetical protein